MTESKRVRGSLETLTDIPRSSDEAYVNLRTPEVAQIPEVLEIFATGKQVKKQVNAPGKCNASGRDGMYPAIVRSLAKLLEDSVTQLCLVVCMGKHLKKVKLRWQLGYTGLDLDTDQKNTAREVSLASHLSDWVEATEIVCLSN